MSPKSVTAPGKKTGMPEVYLEPNKKNMTAHETLLLGRQLNNLGTWSATIVIVPSETPATNGSAW